MARPKQFKAESKRLLDFMINSIYTHKEIFLRELISNASDALDKLYFLSLEDEAVQIDRTNLSIRIDIDKENRKIIISDNGIGMNKKELEENLGTIAKSGSLAFKEAIDAGKEDVDIIGQFGVGFYSAFMVSDEIIVQTKRINEEDAHQFQSNGVEGYTLSEIEKDDHGTTIICTIKENADEEDFDSFLEDYKIRSLIKQYSDYIRYPILMKKEASEEQETSEEQEITGEMETLNSMIPLWKRSKSDITDEEYNLFYKDKYMDFEDPAKVIHMQVEGNITFSALIYIPKKAPFNFYSNDFEKGLQLYSKGVFIMDKANDLIGDYFRFAKGLVDSPDLSLNISREILQHNRQLKAIASRLEKKIKSELAMMLVNEREAYEEFYKSFGLQLKYGIYQDYGQHKELLEDLVMFISSKDKKYVTLAEYVNNMQENQNEIYYVSADSIEKCEAIPQSERVRDKGFEILYLTDDVDEFVIQVMNSYKEKTFKSITQGELDLMDDQEKAEVKKQEESSQDVFAAIKEELKDVVEDVKISKRLKTHPVCLVSSEGLSFEMEKVLSHMPDAQENMKAKRILELNPDHPLLETLKNLVSKNPEKMKDVAWILYDQACLMEGLPIKNPVEFSKKLSDLMIEAYK
jgi:molecular chaperone HtpG